MHVFDIKGNSLAMELMQVSTHTATVIVHKYVLCGLGFVNKQHKSKETKTHNRLVANEKSQIIKGNEMVRAHKYAITEFMPR